MSNKLEHYKLWAFTTFSCLLIPALIGSERAPALLSIVMGGQLLSVFLLTPTKNLILNFVRNRAALIFTLGYVSLWFSFFYSDDYGYLWERLQIKLPLLLYPIAWANVGKFSESQLKLIFYTLVVTIVVSCCGILIYYFIHFEEVNQLYLQSKIMPGPINHIRFSLMAVITAYLIYYFLATYRCFMNDRTVKLLVMSAVFLIIFLHIYSVRSGILGLYIVILICLINYVVKSKNYKNTLLAAAFLMFICLTSFLFSPTLRNKILNTKKDVEVYQNNQDPNYNSLSTRVVSYKVAYQIFKENIWWGCGLGDLEQKNINEFRTNYPTIVTPIIPHNQFIYYLAAVGIVGCFIFLLSFTAFFWVNRFYTFELIQVSYITLLVAFQFEAMIETQVGVACTIIILFLPYHLAQTKKLLGTNKL
ncbi:MAG: O-antigen ligase domain-containing protein [Bacteroidetes bacterium]|nr:MAG: O-antigen ligase domain-containing protein [Bacteroidota bacterium]